MAEEKDLTPDMPGPGALTYSTYLKIPELISLQHPLSEPVAHDELLFIVIHQAYELWFKLINFELESLVKALHEEDLITSFRMLDRVTEIFRVLVQQVDILETMTPVDFNRFRSNLNPASGFQSFQFREMELLAGANPKDYERFLRLEPEWWQKLKERGQQASLRDALVHVLKERGVLREDNDLVAAVQEVYREEKHLPVQTLCEYLIRFDELVTLWRFRHVQMVERMIGMKPGTGGSLGVAYLKQTLTKRFFPELWEARTGMEGSAPYGQRPPQPR